MNAKQPFVSVVIPVYNAEEYLGQCLDSLLEQTLDGIELICVDDSSEDSSMSILEDYQKRDPRIKIIRQKKSNAGEARNRGMEVAQGEYIVFVDADDFCDREMLRKLYEKARELNADTVVCESRTYSMRTKRFAIPSYMVRAELIPKRDCGYFNFTDCPNDIFQLFGMAPWNKMFRLGMLRDNKLAAQSLPAANDVLLTASALICSEKIAVVHEPLYTQRKDVPSSITGRLDIGEKWKCGVLSSWALKDFLEKQGVYNRVRKSYRKFASHGVVWYLTKVRSTDVRAFAKYYQYLKEWIGKLDLVDLGLEESMNEQEYSAINRIQYCSLEDVLLEDISRLEKEAWKKNKELSKIKQGKSYRVGKAVLRYPRKTLQLERAFFAQFHAKKTERFELGLRKASKKRICVAAYETFHYGVTANIISVAIEKGDYVEAFVCSKAIKELQNLLGDKFSRVRWQVYPKQNGFLNRTKSGETNWKIRASEDISRRKELDYVVLVSPEYHPEYYAPIFEKNSREFVVVSGVHNLNSALSCKHEGDEAPAMIKGTDEFFVLDQTLAEFICRNRLTEKKVHTVPLAYDPDRLSAKPKADPLEKDKVRFAITGLVEKERKDYEFVLSALEEATDILPHMELLLLGNANSSYGRHVLDLAGSLEAFGLSVVSYDSFIPDEEFESAVRKSDCLICPVRVRTKTHGFDEVYGQTKLSGAVCDMVQYAIPAIVPSDLNMPSDLKSSFVSYSDSQEFIAAIRTFLDFETRQNYQLEAERNSQLFTLEAICKSIDLFS